MSAQPARHLQVVRDVVADDNGEVITPAALVARIEQLETDLRMAQRDVKAKNRKIADLEFNAAADRLAYKRRPDVERIHSYWQRKCGHPGSMLTPKRFDAVRGILDQERIEVVDGKRRVLDAYSLEDCKRAIDGAAHDHYSKQRKNGSWQHFDDLELIFRDGKQLEEFMARAPAR